ncbi:MAG: CHAT domain-containing protein [Anaerolineae bacterium]|nr:CHAT domain-containing protein [Anaerolineae bacterium]
MQFTVQLTATDDGWTAQVTDPNGAPLLAAPRTLARVGEAPRAFPLPPPQEAAAIPEDALHHNLCTATEVNDLIDAYSDIVGGVAGGENLERFGRYLFTTLLGDALWAQIDAQAGDQPIELLLSWPATDQALNRLPWEMMHHASRFLAEEPEVAIVRVIEGVAHDVGKIDAPPRVLFVVGTDTKKDTIRPGAEYLGLLRDLHFNNLSLKTHLLLQANTKMLEAAIKAFEPSVVHFICHGWFDADGRSYLELVDVNNAEATVNVYANSLLAALRTDENLPLPQIVVLNACYTATSSLWEVGQVAAPLAAELVAGGVPLVVGMAGRVADQACRLFTQQFYRALLRDGAVAHAAAEGRRAGIRHGSGASDPRAAVDWALPTLFLSAGVKAPRIQVESDAVTQNWHRAALEFAPGPFPTFCDRLEVLHWYDLLMADETTQAAASGRQSDIQALALAVNQKDGPTDAPRFGRTWLLKEMAAEAVRDGHVPCLVVEDIDAGADWPKTLEAVVGFIQTAAQITFLHLNSHNIGASEPGFNVANLANKRELATAVKDGLLDFLNKIRDLRPEAERARTKLLLLIDDVHKMGGAAGELLAYLLGPFGLRSARSDVRIAFTYASVPAPGQETAVHAITELARRDELGGGRAAGPVQAAGRGAACLPAIPAQLAG